MSSAGHELFPGENKTDGKYLTFSGQESDLKNLHNEFYEDYEFELSDVDYDEDYERSWGPKEDEDDE